MAFNATSIIRKVMRSYGKTKIWTNKYENYRTVKCLMDADPKKDEEMRQRIRDTLDVNEIPYKEREFIRPKNNSSIIFEVALDA